MLLLTLTTGILFGKTLIVQNALVKAHTEVFGDSTIDPQTSALVSHLQMPGDIASIHGSVDVNVRKLKSDNHKRDEHMVEAIGSDTYPVAHYTFDKIWKNTKTYTISGMLTFHGVKRPLSFNADIAQNGNTVKIKAKSYIKLSDYKIKPIKLLFLTVRDRIDLAVDVTLKAK